MLHASAAVNNAFFRSLGDNEIVEHAQIDLEHRLMKLAAELATGDTSNIEGFEISEVVAVGRDNVRVTLLHEGEHTYSVTTSKEEWATAVKMTLNS